MLLPSRSVSETPGHGSVRRLRGEMGHVKQKCPAVVIFESVLDEVPRGHGKSALPELASRQFSQLIVYRLAEANGDETSTEQNRFDGIKLGQHFPVSGRIFLGEFGELPASAVEVAPLR